MDHIKILNDLSDERFVEESMSSHDQYPALFTGEMSIQDTDCEEFIREKVEIIFQKSRDRWSGLEHMSFCYGINPAKRKVKYTVGVSSNNLTFSVYVMDFIKRLLPKLESKEDIRLQSDDETEDESQIASTPDELKLRKPPHLVQIHADSVTVKKWIESFIISRREMVNIQNIKEFSSPPETRQNCARVDAVLVKRKDTSSHIRVEHVSNLWGPEIRDEFSPVKNKPAVNEHSYSVSKRSFETPSEAPALPSKKKKVYSSLDIASKLEELKEKYSLSKGATKDLF